MANQKDQKKTNLVDILITYISIVSFLNVILLIVGYFFPVISLVLGLLLTLVLFKILKFKRIHLKDHRFHWLIIPILLITLGLRLSPNLYLTGGQDQGTYTSLSKQYQENRSLYIKDELRESMTSEVKEIYDRGNVFLGVKTIEEEESKYIMPFYPVMPSWMATFVEILGGDNRVYALTLFSLLSVVAIYLLSYEISGRNKKVGLLSAFVLAINPLHVYFSRIPLTEVVYLTLFLFSFYFLLRFYSNYKKGIKDTPSLVLSLITINALFYTRMSAIFYLPVILLIGFILSLYSKDKYLKKSILLYSSIWLVLFIISYLFYYLFIPELFNLVVINRIDFNILIYGLSALVVIVLPIILFKQRLRIIYKSIIQWFSKNLGIIVSSLFFLLIGYQLYVFTKEIFIDNSYAIFSDQSLSYFKQLSFLTTFLYLSPLGFLCLPIGIFFLGKKKNVEYKVLLILLSIFLIYDWFVLKLIRYHYYFARYQLSELIPLSIVIISILLISISKKKLGRILLILLVIFNIFYLGFFSIIQSKDTIGADKTTYEYLDEKVDENDLLLVGRKNFESFNQIALPLKYYYNINIFPLTSFKYTMDLDLREFKDQFENVYILTTYPDIAGKSIKLVKEIKFKHNYLVHCRREEDRYFEMVKHSKDIPFCEYIIIPNRFYYGEYTMYLYEWIN